MNPNPSINELEVNLRRLPGVMSVAFDDRNGVLHIQLHIGGGTSDPTLTDRATRLALQFAEGSVALEVNHWQGSRRISKEQSGTVSNKFGGGHIGDAPDPRDGVPATEISDTETQNSGENSSDAIDGLSNRRRNASSNFESSGDPTKWQIDADAPLGGDRSRSSKNWGNAPDIATQDGTGARSGPDSRSETRTDPETSSFLTPDTEHLDAYSNEILLGESALTDVDEDQIDETFSVVQEEEESEPDESFPNNFDYEPSNVIDVNEMEKAESLERAPRTRLLAVLTFPDTDELEVHLSYKGRRGIGRAPASRGVLGASEAAIEALRTWAPDIEYEAVWARPMENGDGRKQYLVATELNDPANKTLHGLATGASPIEAAARSTLHALNRTIAPALALIPDRP